MKSILRRGKLFITSLFLLLPFLVNGQVTTFNFFYNGSLPPSCNPLAVSGNFSDAWKASHGSPAAGDVYGQNAFNKINLVGRWTQGETNAKGEGLFIEYNFLSNHSYNVSIVVAHNTGDDVGLDVFGANGLVENSNSSCGEDVIPDVTDKKLIYSTPYVYDGPLGDFETETVQFSPGKDYKYFWLTSHQNFNGTNGSLLIDQIVIEDVGITSTSPPPPPTCPVRLETDPLGLKFSPADGSRPKDFGRSVSSYGDYLVVGAPWEQRVYVYKMEGCSFQLKAILTEDIGSNYFGWSVDINNDNIIVGEIANGGAGSVYIFKRTDESWTRIAKFSSNDLDPNYGRSVAIYNDYALVGSPNKFGKGKVVFYRNIGQDNWVYDSEFSGPKNESGFGSSVDLKSNSAIVGAPNLSNSIFLFQKIWAGTNIWQSAGGFSSNYSFPGDNGDGDDFGFHVELSEDGLSAFASGGYQGQPNVGEIAICEFTNGKWQFKGTIVSKYNLLWDNFTVNQNTMIISLVSLIETYTKVNGVWTHTSQVSKGTDYYDKDGYGVSMSLTDRYVAVGASEHWCNYSGSVYVYDLFAFLNEFKDLSICGKSYSGALGDINARAISIGCTSKVTYNSGSSVKYAANLISLEPGFNAKAGSSFSATGIGCVFGGQSINGRISNQIKDTEQSKISGTTFYSDKSDILEKIELELSVFPNPTMGDIVTVLSNGEEIKSVYVYNSQGEKENITLNRIAENQLEVKLNLSTTGVYIFEIVISGKTFIKKVVRY